ncbi:MAG: 4'-phosphopantetheinyl transferase superfamily protein [Clostridia bacterium]|nr:4'-phosphopantetheinyl transferase superfamily protein [Clostridia bacterium]
MIYLYDTFENYSDEQYLKHLASLPAWRREKALQYKKLDDRKRSVLAFVLLQRALREEYGMTEVPEFVYNEFGKPSLPNLPLHFSLSHCKDAVACAVSDHNIGIDVESIVPYNPDVARRICTAAELEMLEQSDNKDVDFIKLWTIKEAISKYEGLGLSLQFAGIDAEKYNTHTQICYEKKYCITVCYERSEIGFKKLSVC